jgi:hypothetical protein
MNKLFLIVIIMLTKIFAYEYDPLSGYQTGNLSWKKVEFPLTTDSSVDYKLEDLQVKTDDGHTVILCYRTGNLPDSQTDRVIQDYTAISCFWACVHGAFVGTPCTLGTAIPLGCCLSNAIGWIAFGACAITHMSPLCIYPSIGCVLGRIKIHELNMKAQTYSTLSSIRYPETADLFKIFNFLVTNGYVSQSEIDMLTCQNED